MTTDQLLETTSIIIIIIIIIIICNCNYVYYLLFFDHQVTVHRDKFL